MSNKSFKEFKHKLGVLAKERYGLGLEDLPQSSISNAFFEDETPEEFLERYADDLNLMNIKEFMKI